MTAAQRSALNRLSPKYGIAFQTEPIDLKEIFTNDHPVILDVGFGMGETTAAIASARPGHNFLGVEVYPAGVGGLLGRIEKAGLQNVRIIQQDVVDVLEHMIEYESLDGVQIYFPDPWHKKRHHKRRLIQTAFIELLCRKLKRGAGIHLATDWPDYAAQMLDVLAAHPQLLNASTEGFSPRPDWRPQTKFEARGLRLGHPVFDLIFTKT